MSKFILHIDYDELDAVMREGLRDLIKTHSPKVKHASRHPEDIERSRQLTEAAKLLLEYYS